MRDHFPLLLFGCARPDDKPCSDLHVGFSFQELTEALPVIDRAEVIDAFARHRGVFLLRHRHQRLCSGRRTPPFPNPSRSRTGEMDASRCKSEIQQLLVAEQEAQQIVNALPKCMLIEESKLRMHNAIDYFRKCLCNKVQGLSIPEWSKISG